MKYGEITIKILEGIGDATIDFFDLFQALLISGYGASIGKIEKEKERLKEKRAVRVADNATMARYYKMIAKLKKDGLIAEKNEENKRILVLTERGRAKKTAMCEKIMPTRHYPKNITKRSILVIFDIPEKERRKRNWLRSVLVNLDFQMIQKSVWFGKTILPTEFIKDMRDMRINDYVEILEITKGGSLKQID